MYELRGGRCGVPVVDDVKYKNSIVDSVRILEVSTILYILYIVKSKLVAGVDLPPVESLNATFFALRMIAKDRVFLTP